MTSTKHEYWHLKFYQRMDQYPVYYTTQRQLLIGVLFDEDLCQSGFNLSVMIKLSTTMTGCWLANAKQCPLSY